MRNLSHLFERHSGMYDCIVMLSGGKDSVLALYDIRVQYPGIRVLTVTYDDGYVSQAALHNVDQMTHRFAVDNLRLNFDIQEYVTQFVQDTVSQTVDLCTFTEVFQEPLWKKVRDIATLLGGVPVITGNVGYFSSAMLLPEQYALAMQYALKLGAHIQTADNLFVSYWAEEGPEDFSLLTGLGFVAEEGLSTEAAWLKRKRAELNALYPKRTLDDLIDEHWVSCTTPRFRNGEVK